MVMDGNTLGEMLMKVKGTCPKCGAIMSFEDGSSFAKKNGIKDNVVMCKKCRTVYTINLTPRAMSFATDVTEKYTHLQTASQETTEKKWWQFWK